jgi:hypothetical protein
VKIDALQGIAPEFAKLWPNFCVRNLRQALRMILPKPSNKGSLAQSTAPRPKM